MLAFNPKERWTIPQVLASDWLKKETKTIA